MEHIGIVIGGLTTPWLLCIPSDLTF